MLIYKLTDRKTDNMYIGRTSLPLKKRCSLHVSNYKRFKKGKASYCSSFEILKNDDWIAEMWEWADVDANLELEVIMEHTSKYPGKCVNIYPKKKYNLNKKDINKMAEFIKVNPKYIDAINELKENNLISEDIHEYLGSMVLENKPIKRAGRKKKYFSDEERLAAQRETAKRYYQRKKGKSEETIIIVE